MVYRINKKYKSHNSKYYVAKVALPETPSRKISNKALFKRLREKRQSLLKVGINGQNTIRHRSYVRGRYGTSTLLLKGFKFKVHRRNLEKRVEKPTLKALVDYGYQRLEGKNEYFIVPNDEVSFFLSEVDYILSKHSDIMVKGYESESESEDFVEV